MIPADEECWACNGYGDQHGLGRIVACPWCRGTGLLHEGCHERGNACSCHMGREYEVGDDWFALTGYEVDGLLIARLPGDPVLAEKIRGVSVER